MNFELLKNFEFPKNNDKLSKTILNIYIKQEQEESKIRSILEIITKIIERASIDDMENFNNVDLDINLLCFDPLTYEYHIINEIFQTVMSIIKEY